MYAKADLDEVKRRFVRQNRELVKSNSAQSLRIRSLELDVARLLSENLSLREKVLHLQSEAHKARVRVADDAIDTLKSGLQQKLEELSGLINGLSDLKDIRTDTVQHDATAGMAAPEQQWKERVPLMAAMREHQMPTIVENKSYPRISLETSSSPSLRLSDHSSRGSFDLGIPPVAHIDDDVNEIHPAASPPTHPLTEYLQEELSPAKLAINLETRRKRKEVGVRIDPSRRSLLAQSPRKDTSESGTMLRTGAKRKLAECVSEKDCQPRNQPPFSFGQETRIEKAFETSPPAEKGSVDVTSARPRLYTQRKVLGEKTTNLSPRKNATKTVKMDDEDVPQKAAPRPSTAARRSQRASSIPIASPPRQSPETIEILLPSEQVLKCDLRPKTPASYELLSPDSVQSSAKATKQVDTPPPASLSTINTLTSANEAARPSRRARSAVNYAEPSLVAKMRRPGKELADAVTGLQDPRRSMKACSDKKPDDNSVDLKNTNEDLSVWNSNNSTATLVSAANTNDVQKTKAGQVLESAKAFTDMLNEARAKVGEHKQSTTAWDTEHIPGAREEMDLYEFKDTSPSKSTEESTKPRQNKSHRRHTTVHRDSDDEKPLPIDIVRPVATISTTRMERMASRRKSMMI